MNVKYLKNQIKQFDPVMKVQKSWPKKMLAVLHFKITLVNKTATKNKKKPIN